MPKAFRIRAVQSPLIGPNLHFDERHRLQCSRVAFAVLGAAKNALCDVLHTHRTHRVRQRRYRALQCLIHRRDQIGRKRSIRKILHAVSFPGLGNCRTSIDPTATCSRVLRVEPAPCCERHGRNRRKPPQRQISDRRQERFPIFPVCSSSIHAGARDAFQHKVISGGRRNCRCRAHGRIFRRILPGAPDGACGAKPAAAGHLNRAISNPAPQKPRTPRSIELVAAAMPPPHSDLPACRTSPSWQERSIPSRHRLLPAPAEPVTAASAEHSGRDQRSIRRRCARPRRAEAERKRARGATKGRAKEAARDRTCGRRSEADA